MTIEDVIEAAKNDSTLIKGLVTIVKESKEGKELLENHAKVHFDEHIKPKISEIYNNIDNDIFEILGERKGGEERTFDFVKSKMKQLKKLVDNPGDNKDEVKKLELEIETLKKEGGQEKFWKGTHEEAVAKWKIEREGLEKKNETLLKDGQKTLINSDLTTGLAGLKFITNMPQVAIDAMIKEVNSDIISNSKIEGGKVVYYKADGKPYLDDKYAPITANGIYAERLGDIIDKGNPGGDAKKGKKGSIITVGEGDSATKKLVLDKQLFITREAFQKVADEALLEQGIERHSEEWNKLKDGAAKEYKVSEMNRS